MGALISGINETKKLNFKIFTTKQSQIVLSTKYGSCQT